MLQIPLPEDPAWWDLFNVAKHDLLEVACEVLDLYKLPKAEYAPISKDAQREQRHAAALQQSAASPISGHPTPARSPGTTSVGAVHKVEHARGASAAPAGDPGSGDGVNSAGPSSSALHQVQRVSNSQLSQLLLCQCHWFVSDVPPLSSTCATCTAPLDDAKQIREA